MTTEELQRIFEQTRDRRCQDVPPKYRKAYLRVLEDRASPRQAIKVMCMDCIGWEVKEVANCQSVACPLYCFRPFKAPHTIFPRRATDEVALAPPPNGHAGGPADAGAAKSPPSRRGNEVRAVRGRKEAP